jgi:hypothetical protein
MYWRLFSQIITVQSAIGAANQNRQFTHHVLRAAAEVSTRLSMFALQINRITLWLLHFGGGPLNSSHTMSPLNRDWQDSEAVVENRLLATRFGLHWFYSLLELDRNEVLNFLSSPIILNQLNSNFWLFLDSCVHLRQFTCCSSLCCLRSPSALYLGASFWRRRNSC